MNVSEAKVTEKLSKIVIKCGFDIFGNVFNIIEDLAVGYMKYHPIHG